MFPLIIVLVVSLACGSSTPNTGVKVGEAEATQASSEATKPAEEAQPAEAAPTEAASPTNTPRPQNLAYKVGEVAKLADQSIALYGAQLNADMLTAKFILANTGSSELTISSMISFSAKNADGTVLEIELFDCGGSSFDGSVPAGDILKGQICWTGAQPGAKIYYNASMFGSDPIIWEIAETVADQEVVFEGMQIQQEVFKVGDLIDAKGHYIALTGAEYKGDILEASFIVGNNSDADVSISSMLGFSAKKPSGEKLEQDYFECGGKFDGTVVPGDRLKGKICWKGAEPGSKIYYDATLFSSGMIVWEVTESVPPTEKDYPEISGLTIKQPLFAVGDIVEVRTHKITLNTLTLTGSVLKANFTIENNGTEDVNVSSMISFFARNPDGTTIEQNIFDCGTSMNGTVIPGDKLKGDICWDGAQTGAHVFYDATLFSTGMIIWQVK